jgi:hypothetical protein
MRQPYNKLAMATFLKFMVAHKYAPAPQQARNDEIAGSGKINQRALVLRPTFHCHSALCSVKFLQR